MAEFIDVEYANKTALRVNRYKIISNNPFKANFRCPFCEDSKKSKIKARGWLLEDNNMIHYYCHNCFASYSFVQFLRNLEPTLYQDYIADKFLSKKDADNKLSFSYKPKDIVSANLGTKIIFQKNKANAVEAEERVVDPILANLRKMSDMPDTHSAKKYLIDRQLPINTYDRLYYAPKFKAWINSIIENKFSEQALKHDEPRLVLPFLDYNGEMFGLAGRSFDPDNELRYISIMIDDSKNKFFGLDSIDYNKDYYVLEGGLDSLFIPNSCAMAGADARLKTLRKPENAIIVYDNEPRNKDIHRKIVKSIEDGFRVVIWPNNIKEKDINNMILHEKISAETIVNILNNNTYSGLEAMIMFNKWKRVDETTNHFEDVGFVIQKGNNFKW